MKRAAKVFLSQRGRRRLARAFAALAFAGLVIFLPFAPGTARGQSIVFSATDTGKKLDADFLRDWTSTDGRRVKGTLKDADDRSVTVQVSPTSATVYKIALANLSPADQNVVAEWIARKQARENYLASVGNQWRTDAGAFIQLMRERTGRVPRPVAPTPGFDLPGVGEKPEHVTGDAMKKALEPFLGQKVTWQATFSELERLKTKDLAVRFVEAGKLGDEFTPGGKGRRTGAHPSFNFAITCRPEKAGAWKQLKAGTLVKWTGVIMGLGVNMSFISGGQSNGFTLGTIRVEEAEPLL